MATATYPPVPLAYEGYPGLPANTGTPYGENLQGPTAGMENSRGGPVWGTLSISEPNTSPDVIAIRARPMYSRIEASQTTIPSGTPVAIYSTPLKPSQRQRDDPIHTFVRLQDLSDLPNRLGLSYMTTTPDFIAVTIGDIIMKAGTSATITISLAVQNVTNVFIDNVMRDTVKDLSVGDKVYITANFYTRSHFDTNVQRVADKAPMRMARVATITAPMVGHTIRMDMGELIKFVPSSLPPGEMLREDYEQQLAANPSWSVSQCNAPLEANGHELTRNALMELAQRSMTALHNI